MIEAKIRHLEIIQTVINRMAGNSFLLKGWSVTLVSALFALATKDANELYVYLAYFPCLVFWCLDGYFLHQERMYRKLYQETAKNNTDEIDFDMNANKFKGLVESWSATCFSVTLRLFHGVVLAVIVLVMVVSVFT